MKFKYSNFNGELALYEAEILSQEIYSNILNEDKKFLEEVASNKNSQFSTQEFLKAADQMLQNYNKEKNLDFSKNTKSDFLVMLVTQKQVLKEGETNKKEAQTPKAILRKKLLSNKIRMFKKDIMSIVLDVE